MTTGTSNEVCERHVRTICRGAIALIQIGPRDTRDELDETLLVDLTSEIDRLHASSAVRALFLKGVSSICCTEDRLASRCDAHSRRLTTSIRLLQKLSMSLLYFDKPVIAALEGPVGGAGLGVALNCDFRVATT